MSYNGWFQLERLARASKIKFSGPATRRLMSSLQDDGISKSREVLQEMFMDLWRGQEQEGDRLVTSPSGLHSMILEHVEGWVRRQKQLSEQHESEVFEAARMLGCQRKRQRVMDVSGLMVSFGGVSVGELAIVQTSVGKRIGAIIRHTANNHRGSMSGKAGTLVREKLLSGSSLS